MNPLIGTFVSIRMWSSVSALTEGFPCGGPPPHQGSLSVISIPGPPLKVTSSEPCTASPVLSSTQVHTHTQTHTHNHTTTHPIQMTFADD